MANTSQLFYIKKEEERYFFNLWSFKCDNAPNKDNLWDVLLIESAMSSFRFYWFIAWLKDTSSIRMKLTFWCVSLFSTVEHKIIPQNLMRNLKICNDSKFLNGEI